MDIVGTRMTGRNYGPDKGLGDGGKRPHRHMR